MGGWNHRGSDRAISGAILILNVPHTGRRHLGSPQLLTSSATQPTSDNIANPRGTKQVQPHSPKAQLWAEPMASFDLAAGTVTGHRSRRGRIVAAAVPGARYVARPTSLDTMTGRATATQTSAAFRWLAVAMLCRRSSGVALYDVSALASYREPSRSGSALHRVSPNRRTQRTATAHLGKTTTSG